MSIAENKEKRFQFLKKLYDITRGDTSQTVQESIIGKELGWDPKTTTPLCDFLIDEKMIEVIGYGGIISISHKGVREIKRALSSPKQETQYFPAIGSIGDDQVAVQADVISKSISSIKSTLDRLNQDIRNSRNIEKSEKENLASLIKQLNDALQTAEVENQEAAEAMALSAEDLVKSALKERPNNIRIEITKEGLLKAAQNLANVMPIVMIIAKEIVASV